MKTQTDKTRPTVVLGPPIEMTAIYSARYGHNDSDVPGSLEFSATNDSQAVQELRQFVEDGFRNGTWAQVALSDGRSYGARNEHGQAIGGYIDQEPL
jgi:hypothetical protein